ncbi:phosphonate ABC transporter, permease protein PhnE [Aminobacter anthyllidis]|uniref:Phosphonate ABC transporter, permease protein PhnE n=1 Tax=Aminobacter anthyllidis TaxID=1035067 RepID=A0A9X1D658_9HYPH|nr:phosphonate ABC transporter, permease protein PhnE [Aminobacter anthyllidis]MBT1156691.1 phosphonate ABC transporter, permease protein PhnE [Aminobacter anthyllidis]
MTTLSLTDMQAISERHPDVFAGSWRKTLTGWAVGLGLVAYLAFAWWFFAAGAVLAGGNWGIAGTYLADWVSYEVRPQIDFKDDRLDISYPRFSAYRADRHPHWLSFERPATTAAAAPANKASASHVTAFIGSNDSIEVTPAQVLVRRGGETLDVAVVRRVSVVASGPLPSWATQKKPGEKITVDFGFAGSAQIDADDVNIRHRFFGWENFFFDGHSPYWGKSTGEVMSLIASDERIDSKMSNAALAWDNIVNNSEWQHGDVWIKMLQTIVMAFVGTLFASLLAFPLAFLAARNITQNRLVNQVAKRFFDFLRSVDMLIWALFFTRAFGPGPIAGISAIFFTDTGTFGKLYSEALENIDDKQREGMRSVGASPASVQRYGVVPQVLPVLISQSLYFWESNTRSATIIGAVGAGGIGLKLWEAMRTNSDWENVAYMVLLILIVVFIFDNISTALRQRLIGNKASH